MLDKRHLQHLITDEQLQHFDAQGYLILEDVLPQGLVKELEAPVDQIHQEYLDEKGPTARHSNFFYRDFLGRDQLFVDLLDWYKTFPKVWGILGWNIYSYHSHLIVTPPGSPAELDDVGLLRWHQDSGRLTKDMKIHPPPRMAFKIVYWLSDCSEPGRGNFYIVPGSHLRKTINKPTDGSLPEGAMPVCCKPGDAVFFDGRLWHCRSSNESDITRKGLFIGYAFRWMRAMDHITIPPEIFDRCDPIRQQLLGYAARPGGRFSGQDKDSPLKVWLEEHGVFIE